MVKTFLEHINEAPTNSTGPYAAVPISRIWGATNNKDKEDDTKPSKYDGRTKEGRSLVTRINANRQRRLDKEQDNHQDQEVITDAADKKEKGDGKDFKKFFSGLMKKYDVTSPKQLKGDDRIKFWDEVDAGWVADKETD